jgi:hypothetical protein
VVEGWVCKYLGSHRANILLESIVSSSKKTNIFRSESLLGLTPRRTFVDREKRQGPALLGQAGGDPK